ncbi:MAG TPA: MaoC family dehydratase [Acidimicrobiia bacterium]
MSTPIVLSGLAAVQEAKGRHLGHSDWLEITQDRVDQFADATGDHQWIHVDVERARQGPFGGTIAHGYLTLSMASFFLPQIVRYEGFTMAVNYGVDKVRFPAPVPVGARIRAGAEITEVTDVGTGVQVKTIVTIEIEGNEKPACVIESLSRWFA